MTVRQVSQEAYEQARQEQRLAELTERDRQSIKAEREAEERRERVGWGHRLIDAADNPLRIWFPDEHWHLSDVDRFGNWVVVTPESEMREVDRDADRIKFLVKAVEPSGSQIAGVRMTMRARDTDTGATYWSGTWATEGFLTGPADVGRWLEARRATQR